MRFRLEYTLIFARMWSAKLKDGINFLGKQRPKRLFNATKVVVSYVLSKWLNKPIHWGLPISLSFEPTTSCNLRCPECPSGLRAFTRPTGMLQQELFDKMLNEMSSTLSYLIFYFQGEPYLNKQLLAWVAKAADKGIYTATSTNAHYLTDDVARKTVESGLDRLIISLDGTTQEVYSQYRIGGKLEQVLAGARNVVKWKKTLKSNTPYIVFQFLVVKPNEHQIPDAFALAKSIGVDEVKLKTAQIYDYENGSDLIPTDPKYSRYAYDAALGKWYIKNELLNHCWKLWHASVITWNGTVVPCCFDKDAQYPMGELATQPFAQIWNSPSYKAFRAAVVRSRGEIEMCKNCTEGTKVWA